MISDEDFSQLSRHVSKLAQEQKTGFVLLMFDPFDPSISTGHWGTNVPNIVGAIAVKSYLDAISPSPNQKK